MSHLSVGIIGAGLGGIVLGLKLAKANIPFRIFESSPNISSGGVGITLAPNTFRVLEDLDAMTAIGKIGAPQKDMRILWEDGTNLLGVSTAELQSRFGYPILSFHRSELVGGLAELLPKDTIAFSSLVTDVEDTGSEVKLKVAGSKDFSFSVVVVANGLKSNFRDKILGFRSLRYSGQTSWRGIANLQLADAAEIWSRTPGLRFGYVPLTQNRIYFYATMLAPPHQKEASVSESQDILFRTFKNFPSYVSQILEATDWQQFLRTDIFDLPPSTPWSKGRVVFLGDAIHPTTPNLGQGAGQAIESAHVLGKLLAQNKAYSETFSIYEKRRAARAAMITKASWRLNTLINLPGSVGGWIRKKAIQWTPPAIQLKNMAKIYENVPD